MRTAMHALVLALLVAVVLSACANMEGGIGPKTAIGGLGGAAAGGLLGAALGGGGTGIAAGTILGGLTGAAAGNLLDQRDRRLAIESTSRALENAPSGTSTAWRNPDSGSSGVITPRRTYQTSRGQYCREFQQEITIGGKRQSSYGTACRQADGSWKIVD